MSGNLARLGFELPEWHPEGACGAFPALNWYSDTPREIRAVKAVCARCPVAATCLQDALDRREAWGVWGGLDPDERAEYAKKLGMEPPTSSRHGERARYVGSARTPGCRCDLCRRAHADYEHRRRADVAARGANWRPPTKPCAGCGEQFAFKTERQNFCTHECRLLWEKKQSDAKRQERLARRCARCEGPMSLERQRFCSDQCQKSGAAKPRAELQLAS